MPRVVRSIEKYLSFFAACDTVADCMASPWSGRSLESPETHARGYMCSACRYLATPWRGPTAVVAVWWSPCYFCGCEIDFSRLPPGLCRAGSS